MSGTTLGRGLFVEGMTPMCDLDIRRMLEVKYVACLFREGHGGFAILDTDRFRSPEVARVVLHREIGALRTLDDLRSLTGRERVLVEQVLGVLMESPVWGAEDLHLFGLLEQMDELRGRAVKGGRLV